jgi:hypothetical protein
VIDLTELLAKSLKRKPDASGKAPPSARSKAAPISKKAAARPSHQDRAWSEPPWVDLRAPSVKPQKFPFEGSHLRVHLWVGRALRGARPRVVR